MFLRRLFVLCCITLAIPASAKTSWTRVLGEEGQDNWVLALHALDANTAWIVGSYSSGSSSQMRGYRMIDGGGFSPMPLPQGSGTMVIFTDIAFQDKNRGYITGMDISMPFKLDLAKNILWRTTNGGDTWEVVDDTLEEMIIKIDLFPTGELFLITSKGFYRLESNTLVPGGALPTGSLNLNTLQMLTPTEGFVAGGQGRDQDDPNLLPGQGFLYKTTDGGATWVPLAQDLPFNVTALWFVNRSLGYMGGDDGTRAYLRVTTDGGATWTDQTLAHHPEFTFEVQFPHKFSQTVEAAPPDGLSHIRFFDCERGIALGTLCTGSCTTPSEASFLTVFMRTYDGGITWEMDPDYEEVMDGWGQLQMVPKVVSAMSVVSFADPNHGLMGGQHLMVLNYSADDPEEVPRPGIPDCGGGGGENNHNTNPNNNSGDDPGGDPGFSDNGDSGGCGCSTPGQERSHGAPLVFVLLCGVALVLGRCRR